MPGGKEIWRKKRKKGEAEATLEMLDPPGFCIHAWQTFYKKISIFLRTTWMVTASGPAGGGNLECFPQAFSSPLRALHGSLEKL